MDSLGTAAVLAGSLTQVAGVIVAILGARRTWKQFAPDQELFGLSGRVASAWEGVTSRVRRLLPGRVPPDVTGSLGASGPSPKLAIRGKSEYVSLPDGLTVEEAIRELDNRTREIMRRVEERRYALEDANKETLKEVAALRKVQEADVMRLDKQGRDAATGGVRWSVAGAALVALGLFVEAVGALLT